MIYPRMYLHAESDVVIQIQEEILVANKSNFKIQVEHVKGHQDKKFTFNEMSQQAQLNVKADASATNYLKHGRRYEYQEVRIIP